MNKFNILLTVILPLVAANAEPLKLQVTPERAPMDCCALLSIEEARDHIRALKGSGDYPEDGVIVEFAAGTYYMPAAVEFAAMDSGTESAPIIYRAAKDARVVITGGLKIDKLSDLSDAQVLAQLPEAARSHVKAYPLRGADNIDIPGFTSGGAGFLGKKEYAYELYQASQRLPLARWPNKGHAKTGEIIGEQVHYKDRKDMLTSYSGVFKFNDPARLEKWATEPDMWLDGKWYQHWADQRMQLSAIDLDANTIALKDPKSHAYGFKANRDFYVFNALSELDMPGEWGIDRPNKVLYIWPEHPAKVEPLTLAMTQTLVRTNKAKHLRFEELIFQDTTADAIFLNASEDITLIGCTIQQTGGWAVNIYGGYRCQVLSSDLSNLGEGGVKANGGIKQTLTPSDHLIENCRIHDIAQVVTTYRPGIQLDGVGGKARHNLIYNSPHVALSFDGNDHLFEYNVVHDIALHASDTGAIYACARDWSKRGTIIRSNIVHALGSPLDGAGCRAIYLDDHTSGVTIDGNIVTMSSIGIHIGGGKDNIVTNNLVLNCDVSIDYASRGTDSFVAAQAKRGAANQVYVLSKNSPWQTPLWQDAYPQMAAIFELDPVEAHFASGNQVTHNIMAGGSDVRIQNAHYVMQTSTVDHNGLVDGDPGLITPATGFNFNLKPDAATGDAAPFEPIPFDEIGLYSDPWRPSEAMQFGSNATPLPAIRRITDYQKSRKSALIDIKRANFIKIDALRHQHEWTGRFDARTSCEFNITDAYSDYTAYSQSAYDGEAFYFYFHVGHDANTPLVMEGNWGQRDGLEIALQDPRSSSAPTISIRCYPDGSFKVAPVGTTNAAEAERIQRAITYAAKAAEGLWTAELRLPLNVMDISTAELAQLNFNMNVRRMADQTWMCWARPGGNFWEVAQAGLLKMPSFEEK